MHNKATQRYLDALDEHGLGYRPEADGYRADTPGHPRGDEGTRVTPYLDGVLVHFFNEGNDRDSKADVLARVGLTLGDLFNEPVTDYEYPGGAVVHRSWDAKRGKKKIWQAGARADRSLYGADLLGNYPADATVYVTEGEKDARAMRLLDVPVVSPRQGAETDPARWDWTPLAGRTVVVVADDNDTGHRHAARVADAVTEAGGHPTIVVAAGDCHDAGDHVAAGHGIADFVPVDLSSDVGAVLSAELYSDITAFLDGGGVFQGPRPTVCAREDGVSLFYRGMVNCLYGDPESGKTWIALAAAHEELKRPDGRVLVVDIDHNGIAATVNRLRALGVPDSVLGDRWRFLYAEPEDAAQMSQIVADMRGWKPTLAVVDSMGELLPLYGANSNSADDYTRVNSSVLKPLSKNDTCVIVIDHMAKGNDSRNYGASGSSAKLRTVNGAYIRVALEVAFTPGKGGRAHLVVQKDRHGGLREHCPAGRRSSAGKFTLTSEGSRLGWNISAPNENDRVPSVSIAEDDDKLQPIITQISQMHPPPTSGNDAFRKVGGNRAAALEAFRRWQMDIPEKDDEE